MISDGIFTGILRKNSHKSIFMQKINFIKMHGLGNDFVIIDRRVNEINITKELISKSTKGLIGEMFFLVFFVDVYLQSVFVREGTIC